MSWLGCKKRAQGSPRNKCANRPPTSHPLSAQALGSAERLGWLFLCRGKQGQQKKNKVWILEMVKKKHSQGLMGKMRMQRCILKKSLPLIALLHLTFALDFRILNRLILDWCQQGNFLQQGEGQKSNSAKKHPGSWLFISLCRKLPINY